MSKHNFKVVADNAKTAQKDLDKRVNEANVKLQKAGLEELSVPEHIVYGMECTAKKTSSSGLKTGSYESVKGFAEIEKNASKAFGKTPFEAKYIVTATYDVNSKQADALRASASPPAALFEKKSPYASFEHNLR